jgi:hypothetical protein
MIIVITSGLQGLRSHCHPVPGCAGRGDAAGPGDAAGQAASQIPAMIHGSQCVIQFVRHRFRDISFREY